MGAAALVNSAPGSMDAEPSKLWLRFQAKSSKCQFSNVFGGFTSGLEGSDMKMVKRWAVMGGVCAVVGMAILPASAQVVYSPYPDGYAPFPYSDPSPYDQTFGTRPSFQIQTDPYARGPAVRVIARCNYPDGWNVGDFSRDVNGIPPGIDHQCPEVAPYTGRVRSRY
jgi:hypothetical protein